MRNKAKPVNLSRIRSKYKILQNIKVKKYKQLIKSKIMKTKKIQQFSMIKKLVWSNQASIIILLRLQCHL